MHDVKDNPGFLHLYPLGRGGASWLHMCIRHEETRDFLMAGAKLDDLIVDAMTEEDTRSRIRVRPDGIMVLLKAMHVRDGNESMPEDMVSMRIWIDETNAITTREEDIDPIAEMGNRIKSGVGPECPGTFLADVVELHLDELDPYIEALEDGVNRLDELVARHEVEVMCPRLADVLLRASGFLRHLRPQRQVLEVLSQLEHSAVTERDRARFDDALNQLLRYLETLQNVRERADILNDQVTRIQDRRRNRTSYVFALVATIFLPLSFLTGLFGVNLQGIPMEGSATGFAWLVVGCVALSVLLMVFFRWRRWF